MTHSYSLNLSDEVKKGMTEKALRGELQTPAPLGYIMSNGILVPNASEMPVVKEIFRLSTAKNMSSSEIAAHLNSMGILTKKGNRFQKRSIDYILANPVYAGKIRWRNSGSSVIIADGRHNAIIDEHTYNKASAKISVKKKNSEKNPARHQLLGLLKCKRCGKNMYLCGKIFRCGGYLNKKCSFPQGISAEAAERAVAEKLASGTSGSLNEIIDAVYYDKQTGVIDIRYTAGFSQNPPPI